jgi:hypothetical protein
MSGSPASKSGLVTKIEGDHAATGTAACSIAAAVACHPNVALMKP